MRPSTTRLSRAATIGLAAVALLAGACSSSKSSSSSGGTIASQLSLGGPAECQTNA